mmetsp:Transcript_107306/g.298407  ORF Transcript_107306/g.298407 Transcript_107306/m.298407 type:complete len:174 (-) Transcript_107306:180-701(-)|eukprot:CAMPEP_0176183148 /NCGR_PEP_ID=MMETSP0121_2-20121125/130_1 /TAXON_ID=160619 /ORGANISM="Kryptoperidinium foliaceum, Strain CCMP 1326" /LENGTH=173 /DNA_ID=CAMNT_0017521443 /DNA_START=37 /DNA_END=561 /DNA_ORIENTATION=-
MLVTTLALPSSPPSTSIRREVSIGLQPIELLNGCSEEGCSIESDDPHLTNLVRKHYLEHFGHRNLDGMVKDYADNAIMVNVINGERRSYHGHEEIKDSFREIFASHPTVNSTFHLKHIVIHDRYAMAVWTAKTPTKIYPQSSDTLLFDRDGKILKQFFNCQVSELEHPWYVEE